MVVEDDREAATLLEDGLVASGHEVIALASAEDALERLDQVAVDAMIVDRMLPGLDGLALIASLRARGLRLPVLILSALGQVDDRVAGLRAGGDDYLVKPYHLSELLARIDALCRRVADGAFSPRLAVADLGEQRGSPGRRRVGGFDRFGRGPRRFQYATRDCQS